MWPALRDGDPVARGDTILGATGNFAVFRDGWKFVQFTRRATGQSASYLFRPEEDPNEQRNLIEAEPEIAEALHVALQAFPKAPAVSSFRPPGRRGQRRAVEADPSTAQSVAGGPPWLERAKQD